MLEFNEPFRTDGALDCLIWADESSFGRVRFNIGHLILTDVLHGGNPIHHDINMALCERERHQIEAACRRAFADRPSALVDLTRVDFR
jgi:hypothetical protein